MQGIQGYTGATGQQGQAGQPGPPGLSGDGSDISEHEIRDICLGVLRGKYFHKLNFHKIFNFLI